MENAPIKLLAVRLPEAERRRIKSLAASLGLSVQDAVQQALEMWASQFRPQDPPTLSAQVHRAGADSKKPRRQAPAAKRTPGRRRAAAEPIARPGGAQPQDLEGAAQAWYRKVGTLDWSKCPAAQSIGSKDGNVWIVRGTRVPLAAVIRSFAEGDRIREIAELFGLSQELVKTVLQFAVEGAPLPVGIAKF